MTARKEQNKFLFVSWLFGSLSVSKGTSSGSRQLIAGLDEGSVDRLGQYEQPRETAELVAASLDPRSDLPQLKAVDPRATKSPTE